MSSTRAEVIKLFLCSSQLSMKFQMLMSMKISINSAFSGSDKLRILLFFLLKNVKMPTVNSEQLKTHAQLS